MPRLFNQRNKNSLFMLIPVTFLYNHQSWVLLLSVLLSGCRQRCLPMHRFHRRFLRTQKEQSNLQCREVSIPLYTTSITVERYHKNQLNDCCFIPAGLSFSVSKKAFFFCSVDSSYFTIFCPRNRLRLWGVIPK